LAAIQTCREKQMILIWRLAALTLLVLAPQAKAQAQTRSWPARTITLVVPYPPGASSDLAGRLMADKIATATAQTVIVENKAGAGGVLGSASVATAAADGYTLLLGNNATHVIVPIMSKTPRYDPARDFTAIAKLADTDQYIGINADLPAKNLQELIALAKTQPGKLNFGSAGLGSFGQFSGELLKLQSGIDIFHVPYRGSAAALTDLTAGRIQIMFDPTVVTQKDGGNVRVLASSGTQRSKTTPDVPTAQESGLPNYVMVGWFGLFGPAGLPKEITERLAKIITDGAADPKLQETLARAGLAPRPVGSEGFTRLIEADLKLYRDIKIRANIPDAE
jgi:tripartite-type tricarboxylate transporter receptor subunit TctC